MSFSEWIIARTDAKTCNNFLIAQACICTLCITRELMLNIGITMKGAIYSFLSTQSFLLQTVSMEISYICTAMFTFNKNKFSKF